MDWTINLKRLKFEPTEPKANTLFEEIILGWKKNLQEEDSKRMMAAFFENTGTHCKKKKRFLNPRTLNDQVWLVTGEGKNPRLQIIWLIGF